MNKYNLQEYEQRPPNECPKCASGSKVMQSKARKGKIYKTRRCYKCGHTWSCVEILSDYFDDLYRYQKSIYEILSCMIPMIKMFKKN